MSIYARRGKPVLLRPVESGQYTSRAFTRRALDSGLVQSMRSIGDCYDNGQMESFWAQMQIELLNRQRWSTRLELANATFEYLEIFHNWQRRHSSLGMLSPIEYERRHADNPARDRASCRRDTQGTREQSPIPGRFKSIRYRL
jgi:putative transposase